MADRDDGAGQSWYDDKSAMMVSILGEEHDMVMHAIIPYALGGSLDLYYYPNGVPGTGIATKELADGPGEGPSNDVYDCYELVMFTRYPVNLDSADDEGTEFGQVHSPIRTMLNQIAPYSAQATLNPGETCEFPAEMPDVGGRCLIFDAYSPHPGDEPAPFGMMALIEVFQSEMVYAREMGGAALLEKLKAKGHYPYSDMERMPVAYLGPA